ncbi:hypothetical protein [Thomasclavelia sp.]
MISTTQLLDIINKNEQLSFETLLKQVPEINFVDYLEALIIHKNISKSSLINTANLHRTYAYQIFNGTKIPSRNKVIQLALAMQLDIRETNNLLSLSNNGYLYPKVKFDATILLALKNKYTVLETNLILEQYQLPLLDF